MDTDSVNKSVEQALEATDEEHRVYFEKAHEFVTDIEKYAELIDDIDDSKSHRPKEYSKFGLLEKKFNVISL